MLPKHYASLDTKRLGQAKRAFPLHSQGLDECRSVGKTPRPVLVEVHFFLTRHGHPAFGGRTIVPAGGDHGVAQNARVHFVSFRVHEQPGLTKALRKRGSGSGAGVAFQSIKTARVVDDQQFAGMGRGETGDGQLRVGDFLQSQLLFAIVFDAPDFAGAVVAVNVVAAKLTPL